MNNFRVRTRNYLKAFALVHTFGARQRRERKGEREYANIQWITPSVPFYYLRVRRRVVFEAVKTPRSLRLTNTNAFIKLSD